MAEYILRGVTESGSEKFYTGRAGSGWVSDSRDEAFKYESIDVARRKALRFNLGTQIHGVRFVAIEKSNI